MTTDFTPDEESILTELGISPEPQATEGPEAQAAPTATPASEQPAATPTQGQAIAQQPAAQPTNESPQPGGDVRAALRASRRAEQRARDEAARLREENAALKAKQTAETPEADPFSEDEIARAERDFPLLGKTARFVKEQMGNTPAAPVTTEPTSEFVPPALPPVVQEIVDSSPDLLAWQHDPDQARFALAKSTDALLMQHPHWRDKSMDERFAEVVRRVKSELGAAQPAPVDPRHVIDNLPRRSPETLSHIGGGGGPQPEAAALERYMKMSDDDIVADLLRGG